MAKKEELDQEKAQKFLGQVNPQYNFWVFQGNMLTSTKDLLGSLETMRPEQFTYHVNKEKNDFRNWIRDVVGDRKLASSIANVKTQRTMVQKVRQRVEQLESLVGGEQHG